ncbi:HNH endonuclease [Streptomyces sp. 549]|nr:HNH endonuclease [Streptomyces sp. 549]MDK1473775.1 HNH endonuclease [Streptomyces sp. 549]
MAHVCVACGQSDLWHGRPLVLEIDHINGDRWDNRRQNLRFLCPSCHSQTRTFSRAAASEAHGGRSGAPGKVRPGS